MNKRYSLILGCILSILLTLVSRFLVQLPLLNVLGAMVTAILIGILFRASAEKITTAGQAGISLTAKYILRAGIILMGIRLNFADIFAAGWQTIVLDISVITFTILVIHFLGKKFRVHQTLTDLIAVGTGVCGAAAIGGVAPLIKAKEEDVAISVTIIATLGTLFTVIYTALLPMLGLSAYEFGTFAGSTLHELAHVIATASADGQTSSDIAIVVKLGRVALLAPVAILFGWLYARREEQAMKITKIPIPWFIFGFLLMAGSNTYHIFSGSLAALLSNASIFLLTMAMAAMGMNVKLSDFKRVGYNPILIGLIGSVLLSIFGRSLIWLLQI